MPRWKILGRLAGDGVRAVRRGPVQPSARPDGVPGRVPRGVRVPTRDRGQALDALRLITDR